MINGFNLLKKLFSDFQFKDEKGHYKCYVDDMRTNKDHCSPMSSDLPNLETKAIEYSNEGKVNSKEKGARESSAIIKGVYWTFIYLGCKTLVKIGWLSLLRGDQ